MGPGFTHGGGVESPRRNLLTVSHQICHQAGDEEPAQGADCSSGTRLFKPCSAFVVASVKRVCPGGGGRVSDVDENGVL